MEKKLYFSLSDSEELSGLILTLEDVHEYIKHDANECSGGAGEPKTYTVKQVWMTEEEFSQLPEYEF